MEENCEFFRQCLAAEGINVECVYTAQKDFSDMYYVRKEIGSDTRLFATNIPCSFEDSDEITGSNIAIHAREMARSIEDEMTTHIRTNEIDAKICPYDGGWAKCNRCGRKVKFYDSLTQGTICSFEAEMSVPNPTPYNIYEFVRCMTKSDRELLTLYLYGQVVKSCRDGCYPEEPKDLYS